MLEIETTHLARKGEGFGRGEQTKQSRNLKAEENGETASCCHFSSNDWSSSGSRLRFQIDTKKMRMTCFLNKDMPSLSCDPVPDKSGYSSEVRAHSLARGRWCEWASAATLATSRPMAREVTQAYGGRRAATERKNLLQDGCHDFEGDGCASSARARRGF